MRTIGTLIRLKQFFSVGIIRQVSTEMGEQKSLEMEAQFFEVSAKTGDNISNMFNIIAGSLPTIDTSHISTPTTHSSQTISLLNDNFFV